MTSIFGLKTFIKTILFQREVAILVALVASVGVVGLGAFVEVKKTITLIDSSAPSTSGNNTNNHGPGSSSTTPNSPSSTHQTKTNPTAPTPKPSLPAPKPNPTSSSPSPSAPGSSNGGGGQPVTPSPQPSSPCANPSSPSSIPVSSLKFCDDFSGTSLSSANWNTYITSKAANGFPWNDNGTGGSSEGCDNDAEYYLPSQVSVSNGLTLTASRQTTAGVCGGVSTFAWRSGVVSTYNHFQFKGGYAEFTMQAPSGNGMWPGLWMLPGPGGTNGDDFEIDVQEGGYLPNPANQQTTWHLHGSTTNGGTVNANADLTAGYHTYAVYWVAGQSITWYIDGRQIARLTSSQTAIPNEPMELIMTLNVANSNTSGWHTVYDNTTPNNNNMKIASVRVWQ